MESSQNILLFDVCIEIAAKVGGIYSVIRSKCSTVSRLYGDAYATIGLWNSERSLLEFDYDTPTPEIQGVIDAAAACGVRVHFGRWLISEGSVRAYLLEPLFNEAWDSSRNQALTMLARRGIHPGDCLADSRSWVDGAVEFGVCTWLFLREFARQHPSMGRLSEFSPCAHFHEWQGSVGMLLLHQEACDSAEDAAVTARLGTVFTSHATMLGRLLASDNVNVYHDAAKYQGRANEDEAARRCYGPQHQIEKQSAHSADCFTVVSDVTADEARYLLDRTPDVVTPNGIHIQTYDIPHRMQEEHARARSRIDTFARGYFRGRADAPAATTPAGAEPGQGPAGAIYMFTAGRYEFSNKGYDIFIRALGRLDRRLRAEQASGQVPTGVTVPRVVAFIIVPAPCTHVAVDTYDAARRADHVHTAAENVASALAQTLEHAATLSEDEFKGLVSRPLSEILDERAFVRYRVARREFSRDANGYVPLCTHALHNQDTDQICQQLVAEGLVNGPDNVVQVCFHPRFLDATDSPVGLDYPTFVRGAHFGVFPSFYEPWGLTPAECIASGVPCVTTNTSGFGRYTEGLRSLAGFEQPDHKNFYQNMLRRDFNAGCTSELERVQGVYVADRIYLNADETADRVADAMSSFVHLRPIDRVSLRSQTAAAAHAFDWQSLIAHYDAAHSVALEKANTRLASQQQ